MWFLCWRNVRADHRSDSLCSYSHGAHGDEHDMNIQHPNHPAITATSIARVLVPLASPLVNSLKALTCFALESAPAALAAKSAGVYEVYGHSSVNGEIIMKFYIGYFLF